MKKLLVALILGVILTVTLATPVFAGPPEDAGKGTVWNEGLENAYGHVIKIFYKNGNAWPATVIDWLSYYQAGPPPWFAQANFK